MSTALLSFDNVRKTYQSVIGVENLCLELKQGEFLSLLGPSGSGKTTSLMMVAGLVDPTSGSILLESKPLNPLPPYKRNIGMVFQNYALFPHMTVRTNVAFPLMMRKRRKADISRKVDEVLQLVGLPDHGDRYPKQLSGGQQQRVALARAMVYEPRLLLLDEPLGALDKKLREQMQLEIKRMHQDLGIAMIYVTHDQEEALVMSDRIAVFNHGHLEQVGTPEEIYEHPANRFVADFIGESNVFVGRVLECAGDVCKITWEGMSLEGRASVQLQEGAHAAVVVRPERIWFRTSSTDGLDVSVIRGEVKDIIYLGQSVKYVIRSPGGQEILVGEQRDQNRKVNKVEIGAPVELAWRLDDGMIFPEE